MNLTIAALMVGVMMVSCGVSHLRTTLETTAAKLDSVQTELDAVKATDKVVKRLYAAERVIREVIRDEPDYVMDGLAEGDAYQNWLDLGGKEE